MQPEIEAAKIPDEMTTDEISKFRQPVYEFEGDFANIFRLPGRGFSAMIYGKPGNGKSAFSIQLAKYLGENWADVLYVSREEYPSESLFNNIERNDAESQYITIRKDYETDLSKYDFVFLDSINSLNIQLSEFIELKEKYPNTSFLLIFQTTKEGNFRGGQDWQHEVDTIIEVKSGEAQSFKRYSPNNGEVYGIFNNKKPTKKK